jgi:hypothetical protein
VIFTSVLLAFGVTESCGILHTVQEAFLEIILLPSYYVQALDLDGVFTQNERNPSNKSSAFSDVAA